MSSPPCFIFFFVLFCSSRFLLRGSATTFFFLRLVAPPQPVPPHPDPLLASRRSIFLSTLTQPRQCFHLEPRRIDGTEQRLYVGVHGATEHKFKLSSVFFLYCTANKKKLNKLESQCHVIRKSNCHKTELRGCTAGGVANSHRLARHSGVVDN